MPLRLEVLALHPAGPPRKQGPLRRPWSPQSSGSPPRQPTGGRAGTHSPKIHSFSTPGVPENSGNWPTQSEPPPSPPSQCPRRRGGGTFSTGARETTRGQPRRHTSGTPTPRVAARAPWPAPARQRTAPPSKRTLSPVPRERCPSPPGSGGGPWRPQRGPGANGGQRGRAALDAQEAEEKALQAQLSSRGLPRPLPETAASPGRGVHGSRLDGAEARNRPRGAGPKPPAVPGVRPTRGETGTNCLVSGGTTAARARLSRDEGVCSGARPSRFPLGGHRRRQA